MIKNDEIPKLNVKPNFKKSNTMVKNISEDIFKKFNEYKDLVQKKKEHKRKKDSLLEDVVDNTLKKYSIFEKVKSIGDISSVKEAIVLILNQPESISDPTLAKQIIEGHIDLTENIVEIASTYYLKEFSDTSKEYSGGGSIFDLYYPVREHTRKSGQISVRAHYRLYRYR